MISCPFTDTAGSTLLRQAIELDPDFSEWRDKPQHGDIDVGAAPEIAGQYLAKKKLLLREKKSQQIPVDQQQAVLVAMTTLTNLAELEFLNHIQAMELRKRMRMRSSGRIVIVKNDADK